VGAVAAGVAAPLILEQMGRQLHTDREPLGPPGNWEPAGPPLDWESQGRPRIGPSPSLRRRKSQGRLGGLAREVAFGLIRSTPAFGGTVEL
jgi:hypothetical protein